MNYVDTLTKKGPMQKQTVGDMPMKKGCGLAARIPSSHSNSDVIFTAFDWATYTAIQSSLKGVNNVIFFYPFFLSDCFQGARRR